MIHVRYSCAGCGLEDVEVLVPERGWQEDVVVWMRDSVQAGIGIDHGERSPSCASKTAADVKIPAPKYPDRGQRIGDADGPFEP